jgi:ABC-type thiamine transport system ATPase subunit
LGVYLSQAVAIVRNLHQNHVPALINESGRESSNFLTIVCGWNKPDNQTMVHHREVFPQTLPYQLMKLCQWSNWTGRLGRGSLVWQWHGWHA